MFWERPYLIFFIMILGTKSRNMLMVQSRESSSVYSRIQDKLDDLQNSVTEM